MSGLSLPELQNMAEVADFVRTRIAANLNGTIAAMAAAITLALIFVWTSDRVRKCYTNTLNKIGHMYDRLLANRKRQLLCELESLKVARGDGRLAVLEIGCGQGNSLRFYPVGSEIVCVEPNPRCKAIVYEAARQFPGVQISAFHVSSAEKMREVESESVDAVVSLSVLCTVSDPKQCLREIVRVLKPGGKLFFLEHVKAPRRFYMIRFLQVLIELLHVWSVIFDGCCIARDTEESIRKSGFRSVNLEEFEVYELVEKMGLPFRLVRTHISGTATK